MCGFVGFTNHINDASIVVEKMMDRIAHRGPDQAGKYVDEKVAMGFRRLSIIDLSELGSQPMFNEDGSVAITFNGEIYNFQELREELIAAGHKFKSKADTEVLIHGYEQWDYETLLNKLRGMFGFVIYDKNKDLVFGARDFFGIKPVYYGKFGETLMWGSEIKSFLEHPEFKKELNTSALENYLTFQYSPTTETFFKNVYKLPAAHYFTYCGGKLDVKRYWEIKFTPDEKPELEDWVNDITDTFKNSVSAHKIADVEVGSFLSSGVDSSYVAAVANVDKTFTVGFGEDEKYNVKGSQPRGGSLFALSHVFSRVRAAVAQRRLLIVRIKAQGKALLLVNEFLGVSLRADDSYRYVLAPHYAQSAPRSCHGVAVVLVACGYQHPSVADVLEWVYVQRLDVRRLKSQLCHSFCHKISVLSVYDISFYFSSTIVTPSSPSP